MDGKLNVFQAIARKMDWLGQRQQVLAKNIANADTPDYVPQDLKGEPFRRLLTRRLETVQPATTNPMHIKIGAPSSDKFETAEQRRSYEVAPSGNAVVLEEQLIKVTQTQMDYQSMSNLYRKHLNMIRTALGQG